MIIKDKIIERTEDSNCKLAQMNLNPDLVQGVVLLGLFKLNFGGFLCCCLEVVEF